MQQTKNLLPFVPIALEKKKLKIESSHSMMARLQVQFGHETFFFFVRTILQKGFLHTRTGNKPGQDSLEQ